MQKGDKASNGKTRGKRRIDSKREISQQDTRKVTTGIGKKAGEDEKHGKNKRRIL